MMDRDASALDDGQRELFAGCQRQERAAWRAFSERYSDRVYRWALFLGLRPAEAEDAAQEVLTTAIRRIDTCRAPEALHSWLFQITRRVVANARRMAWVKRLVFREPADEAGLEHVSSAQEHHERDVRACLLRLPRSKAEVLLLVYVEGYTKDEAADMLGIPPGTVASRLKAAKEAFADNWWGEEAVDDTLCARRQS